MSYQVDDALEVAEEYEADGLEFCEAIYRASINCGADPKDVFAEAGRRRREELLEEHKRHLASTEWAQTRARKLAECPHCERCKTSWSLQVHHRTYVNVPREEMSDLEVLCRLCHEEEHGRTFEKETEAERFTRLCNPPGNKEIAENIRRMLRAKTR
ncbi:hypothetical protein IAD21_00940 [Abditibacteriota bacterium]|nr:hypothetical protein IAD21_00940 [Abditibacteriota bacterium]